MHQPFIEIVVGAGSVLARDLFPTKKSVIKTTATLIIKGSGWMNTKALDVLPNLPNLPKRKAKPAGPVALYDAVNVANIPANAAAVAGYVNGSWPTFSSLKAKFPKAKRVSIAVNNSNIDAEFLDVETGDATPEQAPEWVLAKLKRNSRKFGDRKPGIYANRSTMPQVWALLVRAGVKRNQVRLWVADWTGSAHVPTGYDGCQWHGGMTVPFDESLCLPSFFV